VNVFDLWEGANFKLKIKKVAGYWNYDSSEFDSVSALSADDTALEKVWKSEYSLEAFSGKENFKTYEELEARLNLVLGLTSRPARQVVDEDEEEFEPVVEEPTSFRSRVSAVPSPVKAEAVVDDDDALSYFARLAEED